MTRNLQYFPLPASPRRARWKEVIRRVLIIVVMTWVSNAVLSGHGTLTASKVYQNPFEPAYDNCLSGGVNNEKFQPWAASNSCCYSSGDIGQAVKKWFQIVYGTPKVFKTVLVVFPENIMGQNRPSGADFFVSLSTSPSIRSACGTNPIKSGVYTCNGLVGDTFRYEQPSTISNSITSCEVRIYSLLANEYPSTLTSSGIASCSDQSPLLNRAFFIRAVNCMSPLTPSINPFYLISFDQTRHIHVVTMIGTPSSAGIQTFWSGSINLIVKVFNAGSSVFTSGTKSSTQNSYGFEEQIGKDGDSIKIYRTDTGSGAKDITLAWLGIFTTKSNCPQSNMAAPTPSWSAGQSFFLGSVYEFPLTASLDDCPLAQVLTLTNGNPVPSFITYNAQTFLLRIDPASLSHLGTYALRLYVRSDNKITNSFERNYDLPSFNVQEPTFLWGFSATTVSIDVSGPAETITWSVRENGIDTTDQYQVELDSPVTWSSTVTITGTTLSFRALTPSLIVINTVGLRLIKTADSSIHGSQNIQLFVIDRCNELPISVNFDTFEAWGLNNPVDTTGYKVYVGFTQTINFAKPFLDSSSYSYQLSCGLKIEPLDAASTTLLTNQVTKVETSTKVSLSLNFATPGEQHTLQLRIYVVNQSNQAVSATEQRYSLIMNTADICLEYTINLPWSGLSTATSASSRQRLFLGVPFQLQAQTFSFATHEIDSPTLCKKTFEWVDAADNLITSTYLAISPQQSGPSPASILPQVQVNYPTNVEFFMRACIKDVTGNVILAGCEKTTFYAEVYKEFCDVYVIDASWASMNPFWTSSSQALIDVFKENYVIAPIAYTKDPTDQNSRCSTEKIVQYSTDEGQTWFDKTQLVPQLQTYPASLKAKLVGNLKNSEGVLRDQKVFTIDVNLTQICLVVNEFFFDQPNPISFQYKVRSTAKTLTFPYAREVLIDSQGNSYCGPSVYQLFDSTGQPLVDNRNDYLSLKTNAMVELTLETANPYHTITNKKFFLLIYKSDWFDVTSFNPRFYLDPKVAIQRNVNVNITNCIVPELKWPTPGLALNLVIGSSNPTVVTHSDLRSSNTCNYPIAFRLFWDQKNEVNDVKTHDFTQLAANGLPSFVSYQNPTVTVNSEENTQGQYKMYIVAEITDFWQVPPVHSVLPATINISARLPNKPPMLKDPLPQVSFITGQSQSFYVPVSKAIDLEGDSITARVILNELFMTWDSTAEAISIDGTKALESKAQGVYTYTVQLTDGKGAQSSNKGTVTLSLGTAPAERSDELKYKSQLADQVVAAGQTLKITLPKFAGPNTTYEQVNLGETDILTYDPETRTVFVNARNEKDAQEHEVTLTLSESGGQLVKQIFKVKVISQRVKGDNNLKQATNQRALKARFESASEMGLVRIKFSESVIPSESDALAKINQALLVEAFAFDYSTEAYSKQVPMKFECTKLKDQTMELQLTFEQPALVSTGSKPDRVYVHFVDERLFIAEDGLNQIEPDYLVFGDLVPQFSSPAQASVAKSVVKTTQGTSFAVVVGLIVGQLAGKEVIKRVVPLFMALQVAVLVLDYEHLQRPVMPRESIRNIKGIITMEALNPKALFEKFWPAAANYMSNPANFIANINPIVLGAIGVVAVGSVVGAASYIIVKLKTSPDGRISQLVTKVKSYLLFNPLIASVQVSYLTLGVSTGKYLKTNISGYQQRKPHRMLQDIIESAPRGLNELVPETLMVILLVTALLAVLGYVARLIQTKPAQYFAQKEVKGKIGALYSNLGLESHQLHFATFFFARRLFLALVLFFIETPVLKIELVSLSSFAAIYYCLRNSPYADRVDTKIEIFNESMIIAANYWQIAFSDIFLDTPLRKIDLGWFYIVLLSVLILVNFYFLFMRTVVAYIVNWLKMRRLRNRLLEKQELEAARLKAQQETQSKLAEVAPQHAQLLTVPESQINERDEIIKRFEETSSKILAGKPNISHVPKIEINTKQTKSKQQDNLMIKTKLVVKPKKHKAPIKKRTKSQQPPVDSMDIESQISGPRHSQYPSRLSPEKLNQAKQVEPQKNYSMTYSMPKDLAWTLRAKRKTAVLPLIHIVNEPLKQRAAIINECQFHQLPQNEAEKLADHFISKITYQDTKPNIQLDRQVIWIAEAAQQRHIEKLEAELADVEAKWDKTLRQREEQKRHIQALTKAQITAIEVDSPEQHLAALLISLTPAQLVSAFLAQCDKMEIHEDVVISLIHNLKQSLNPLLGQYARLDPDTGHILNEIRVERLALEQCRQKIEQLEKNWEEEDLEILHDITNYKESIEEMKQLQ